MLSHSKAKIFSDNQNVCSIIQKGSLKPLLNDIGIDIFFNWYKSHQSAFHGCLKFNMLVLRLKF